MSLLNDALVDLDRRREAKTHGAPRQFRLMQKSFSAAQLKQMVLISIAVVVVAAWLVIEQNIFGLMTEKKVAEAPVSPSTENIAPALTQDQEIPSTTVEGLVDQQATVAETVNDVTAAEENSATEGLSDAAPINAGDEQPIAIKDLLQQAQDAFSKNQLLTPIDNNAYQLYRSVLALQPGHIEATRGIIRIQEYFLNLAEESIISDQFSKAKLHLFNAQKAGATPEQIRPYEYLMRSQGAAPRNPSQSENRKPTSRVVGGQDYDAQLAQQLRADPYGKFESKAWSLVDSGESARGTIFALADTYAAKRNFTQLRNLVSAVNEREADLSAYVQGQWLIMNGDLHNARDVLQTQLSVAKNNTPYLRLLAGVHSALNDFASALPIYQQLTSLSEFNVNDWLGYAVALEHQGNAEAARQAYQKISRIEHPDPRINAYVNQRIRELAK
jgi:hypothetical protein